MGHRIIAENAEPCPFCGNPKIFIKATTEGSSWSAKRYAVSGQCSKCHVHGPQIFGDYVEYPNTLPSFEDLPDSIRNELIALAIHKWNTRYDGRGQVAHVN